MSEFSVRRVKLAFTLSLFTAALAFVWLIIAYFLQMTELAVYIGVTVLLFLVSALISKKGSLTLSRIIYMLALNVSVSLTASYVGKAGSVEFVLMFAMALPFIMFSFRREKHFIMLFTGFSIILWLLLYVTDFKLYSNSAMDAEIAGRVVYPFSIASTIILVTFQLIYFSLLNARFYGEIHEKREEAIEASNAKSQFLSTMSHEIRTPLNAIIGLSHILGDSKPRPDQEQNIEALNYSGKILLNLLNNVLDFSKMESKTIDLDPIPTNIEAAVKQIKKIHEANCLRKGIHMKVDIDENLPLVFLDVVRFNQVVNNLISNAIKFTEKGSVTLRITKEEEGDDSVSLKTEIIDTGIGISPKQQEKIWEAFTQASASTNRLYGGTGLGLPIVKKIVEAMGGLVRIKSEMGKGSCFYFGVKLKKATHKELNKTKEKIQHDLKGKKVLLVEDNEINIMVGKQILEKANLKVSVAKDGLEAVEEVKANHYDAVLMDIQMPIMDGYTASSEIRKFNTTLPILALSASVFMEVKDKIHQSGMNGFIFKPFEPEDLLNQVEEAVNNPLSED
jgi:signal transduction histidine kinase/CheY-like chemotaxis protein